MIPNDQETLQQRLFNMRQRLEHIDALDAPTLRRMANECRRLARECQQKYQVEELADRFEALSVDIAMELDERTVSEWLSDETGS